MFSSWTTTEQWRKWTVPWQEEYCCTLAKLSLHVMWQCRQWLKVGTLEPHVLALWLRTSYLTFLSFSVRISKMGIIKWPDLMRLLGVTSAESSLLAVTVVTDSAAWVPPCTSYWTQVAAQEVPDGAVAVVAPWVVGWGNGTAKPGFELQSICSDRLKAWGSGARHFMFLDIYLSCRIHLEKYK